MEFITTQPLVAVGIALVVGIAVGIFVEKIKTHIIMTNALTRRG